MKDADVGAYVDGFSAGVDDDGVYWIIGKGVGASPGEIDPIRACVYGLPYVAGAAGEAHHGDVGGFAGGIGSVDGDG